MKTECYIIGKLRGKEDLGKDFAKQIIDKLKESGSVEKNPQEDLENEVDYFSRSWNIKIPSTKSELFILQYYSNPEQRVVGAEVVFYYHESVPENDLNKTRQLIKEEGLVEKFK